VTEVAEEEAEEEAASGVDEGVVLGEVAAAVVTGFGAVAAAVPLAPPKEHTNVTSVTLLIIEAPTCRTDKTISSGLAEVAALNGFHFHHGLSDILKLHIEHIK